MQATQAKCDNCGEYAELTETIGGEVCETCKPDFVCVACDGVLLIGTHAENSDWLNIVEPNIPNSPSCMCHLPRQADLPTGWATIPAPKGFRPEWY